LVSDVSLIQAILVCQGAEYKAVCAGLSQVKRSLPNVMPNVAAMPVGRSALKFLEAWQQQLPLPSRVLVTGLCGSLNPRYAVGSTVLYRHCLKPGGATAPLACDRSFTQQLQARLQHQVAVVSALTSDRVIHTAAEKQHLAQVYEADVVDMEGFAVLETLQQIGVEVAMLRVISDDCGHDLPDLTDVFSSEGVLRPQAMAIAMLRKPIAAAHLIQGSLRSLKVLQAAIAQLLTHPSTTSKLSMIKSIEQVIV
jgi:hypothetical protein